MPVLRAKVNAARFNASAALPYELRARDIELAMQDVYDLLFDANSSQVRRGLDRVEEIARAAVFSGLLSDALTKSVAKHSRALADNQYHNGHPDLIPRNIYPNNAVKSGEEGVEVKVTSMEISVPVPVISPSPWVAWPSPSWKSAPATKTGR